MLKILIRHSAFGVLLLLAVSQMAYAQVRISASARMLTADDGFSIISYELLKGKKKKPLSNPKAVFFYIQGSEPETVLDKTSFLASAVIFGGRAILAEKRGCYPDSIDLATFKKFDDKPTRISDHAAVIRHYLKDVPVTTPVVLIGGSEGGDIASVLATQIPRVSQLILIGSGGGWSQRSELRRFVEEQPGYLGVESVAQADSLAEVFRNPAADTLMWAGHTGKRWRTYMHDSTITWLRRLDIPILLIHGSADASVPVGSARAIDSVFKAAGKNNLKYVELAGTDHSFKHVATGKSHYPLVEIAIIEWFSDVGMVNNTIAQVYTRRVKRAHRDLFANER